MQCTTAFALAAACLLAVASPAAAWGTGPWLDARATYYGLDAWSIHTGSCGFGFICPNRWSDELAEGEDVTAVSDKGPFYGHCGECLEVRCRPTSTLPDGDGGTLDRSEYCINDVSSVKVKIVDTCPCNYAANAASNKRWCCGDYLHLDMSQWALQKLVTEIDQGVFGISVRTIDCTTPISDPAAPLATPLVDPHADLKPAGLNCATQSTGSAGSTDDDSGTITDGTLSTPTASTPTSSNARTAVASTPTATPTAAPTPKPTQSSRKELTTESTSAQRATTPTSAPTASFSINAITKPKTPGAVKMAVPWWHQRQQEYLSQGSTDSSGLPTSGSTANYWSAWWLNIFPTYSAEQKTSIYKTIWERITAGTLNVSKYGAPGGKK